MSTDLARIPRVVTPDGEIIELADALPALSYDRAVDLMPVLEDAARRIARLREFTVSVIEADCAANGRSEVRIGGAVYTYRPGTAYVVDDPAGLHAALVGLIGTDGMTGDDVNGATRRVEPPPVYAQHNGRLNGLAKLGGSVAATIARYRRTVATPARLEKK